MIKMFKTLCMDAKDFLATIEQPMDSVFTSLPDWDEVDMDFKVWLNWFEDMVKLILQKTDNSGYAIFYQTDRKLNGTLISKAYIILKCAELCGFKVIWHKIGLRVGVDKIDLYRPAYTHIICLSKNGTSSRAFSDVFEIGKQIYDNGMGISACTKVINFLKTKNRKLVYDPFCGEGTVLQVCFKNGIDCFGVDINPEQITKTQSHLSQINLSSFILKGD